MEPVTDAQYMASALPAPEADEPSCAQQLLGDIAPALADLICKMLRSTIARTQESGDFGTATLLKQVLMSAEDRAHHLDHYLAEDGLRQG